MTTMRNASTLGRMLALTLHEPGPAGRGLVTPELYRASGLLTMNHPRKQRRNDG